MWRCLTIPQLRCCFAASLQWPISVKPLRGWVGASGLSVAPEQSRQVRGGRGMPRPYCSLRVCRIVSALLRRDAPWSVPTFIASADMHVRSLHSLHLRTWHAMSLHYSADSVPSAGSLTFTRRKDLFELLLHSPYLLSPHISI